LADQRIWPGPIVERSPRTCLVRLPIAELLGLRSRRCPSTRRYRPVRSPGNPEPRRGFLELRANTAHPPKPIRCDRALQFVMECCAFRERTCTRSAFADDA